MITREYIRSVFTLIVVVGIFLVLTTYSGRTQSAKNDTKTPTDSKSAEIYWQERIKHVGGASAYIEFGKSVQQESLSLRHLYAHSFGAALYQQEGVASLTVCDTQFSYGCFHEFLGRAIAQDGLDIVLSLNNTCREKLQGTALSCQHGIGHGIAAYIGYSPENLDEELLVCKGLPYNDTIGGCYAGVFMEYNLRTMLGVDAEPRPVEEGGIFAPCNRVEDTFKPACMYWQPQWWQQKLYGAGGTSETFAQLGKNCIDMTTDEKLRKSCFEGIGVLSPNAAEYEPKKAAVFCDAVSSNKLYVLFCKSTAANAITIDSDRKDATETCTNLSAEAKQYCIEYAANRANMAKQRPVPEI